jgi:hypothetical protein
MTASEMAVVESSARICVTGNRSFTSGFENGVNLQSAEYSTQTDCARTDSVMIMTTFLRVAPAGGRAARSATFSGVRGPGWRRSTVSLWSQCARAS